MKNIEKFLTESKHDWSYQSDIFGYDDIKLPNLGNDENKWLFINTEGEMIAPISESDLENFADDMEDDTILKECKKLKIGESYDADGGISIYIRIK